MKGKLFIFIILVGFIFACKNPFWNIEDDIIEIDLQDDIEFTNDSVTKTYGDPKFTNAIASTYLGTGSIVYSSGDKDVAVVDENTGEVTIKGVGETTITAVKAADVRYAQAEASYTLKVNKGTLTVSVIDKAVNINNPIPEYTYEINGFVYNEKREITITGEPILSCDYTEESGRGSYPITIEKGTLNSDNYEFEFVDGALSVGLKVQDTLSITESYITKTWGDGKFTLSTIGGSGKGRVRYRIISGEDVIRIRGNTVTILKAGTAEVIAQRRGDDEFNHTASLPIPITIDKRNLSNASVTAGGTFIYTGHVHTPEPIVTDNDLITASDYTVEYDNNVNAGIAAIIITAANDGNYTGTQSGNFNISKATLTVTADDIEISFNDPAPGYTYTITGFVSGEDEQNISGEPLLSCIYSAGNPVGAYEIISVIGSLSADNYDFVFVYGELSVGLARQAALILNNVSTKTYGDSNFNLSTTGGSGTGDISYKLINGADVIDINKTTGEVFIKRAGTAEVYARKKGDDGYSPVRSEPITITVNKRNLSHVSVNINESFIYNGQARQPTPSVTDGGLIKDSDWDVLSHSNNVNAGTATVTITAAEGGNYTGTQSGTFTINQALLTVTADDIEISFNDPVPNYTYTITGFVSGESSSVKNGHPLLSCDYSIGNSVGTYTITPSRGTLTAANYDFTFINGELSVGKTHQADLFINDVGTKTYGDSDFYLSTTGGSGTGVISYRLMSGSDVIDINENTGLVSIKRAGTATVDAKKEGDSEYSPIHSEPVTITVNKRSISLVGVSFTGTLTYNGQAQQQPVSLTDGGLLKASDWFMTCVDNINAGLATLTITATDDGNYTGSMSGNFVINRAVLTVTADNINNIIFNSPVPEYTYTITGFVNGETSSVVSGTPAITCSYVQGNNAGNYAINISAGNLAAGNYNFTSFVQGTLTVGKADPIVHWPTNLTATPGMLLYQVALPGNFSSNLTSFSLSWGNSQNSVGGIGKQAHSMTFYPQDSVNYNSITGNVIIHVSNYQMVWIRDGSFELGRNLGTGGGSDITPVSTVSISGFWMGRYQVTQELYQSIMGNNPSYFNGGSGDRATPAGEIQGRRPVDNVNWYDAILFCNRLSMAEGLSPAYRINGSTNPNNWGAVPTTWNDTWDAVQIVYGSNGYRLPTEAQWEYAAKGGNGSPGSFTYSGSNAPDTVAWYRENSGSRTHEVGKKAPNGLGIYDMSGNVVEWCWDWFGSYTSGTKTDPTGASGFFRVRRGGCWADSSGSVRSVYRDDIPPGNRSYYYGFRVSRP